MTASVGRIATTDGLPEQAACKKCKYLLRGLSEPRCPECGEPFDPGDARTYWLPGHEDDLPWLPFGIALSFVHVLAALALGLHGHLWGNAVRGKVATFISSAMMQPARTLFPWSGEYFPEYIRLVPYVLNSGLWGVGTAYLIWYVRRRRRLAREGAAE